jgi:hypothetical protein
VADDERGGLRDLTMACNALERANRRLQGVLHPHLRCQLRRVQVQTAKTVLWLRSYQRTLGSPVEDLEKNLDRLDKMSGYKGGVG